MYIATEMTQRKLHQLIHERYCHGACDGQWGAGGQCQVISAFMLGHLMPEISREMFPLVRADQRARVREEIMGELVCCDLEEKIAQAYASGSFDDQIHTPYAVARALDLDWHDMCYYGAWAARIAGGPGAATPGL